MKKISVNLKYLIMQGAFFFMFCSGAGFISLFLQGIGFSESQIGFTVAIFSTITAIIQPIIGNLSDRFESLNWKKMITILSIMIIVVNILMVVVQENLIKAILLGLFFICGSLVVIFINSAHYYYENRGDRIDFGMARGVGSGTFAGAALIIGNFAERYGIITIPYAGAITAIIFFFTVIWMPYSEIYDTDGVEKIPTSKVSVFSFIKKYPVFSIMLLSVFFLHFSQNMVGVYLLQVIQSLEGNSSHLGTAIAIQAVVEIPMLFAFSKILKKVQVSTLMVIAAFGYIAKAFMYAIAKNISMIYLAQTFQILSFAILVAASVYYTGRMVSKEDQTTGQAFMASMPPAAMVAGSLLGGWMLENLGVSKMLYFNVAIAGVGLIIGLIANAAYKKKLND